MESYLVQLCCLPIFFAVKYHYLVFAGHVFLSFQDFYQKLYCYARQYNLPLYQQEGDNIIHLRAKC